MFADVEGQGDRDAAYDARLASAILPVTKCVIFNWRDSLQVDRMLNLLGVMQRAARNVDLGEFTGRYLLRSGGRGRVFFVFWVSHAEGREQGGRMGRTSLSRASRIRGGFRVVFTRRGRAS